jgi:dTDP-glucose 4,6-dehydratase/UDP-glucose 4-epimerase
MARALVTGGGGFIGSALAARMAGAGHQVRVLDDFSRGKRSRLRYPGIEVIAGDIRDPGDVARAMAGCDQVWHLAYLQGTQTFYAEPRAVLETAVRGMLNVLDGCQRSGCADLVLISSSEAYQTAAVVPTPENVPLTVPDPLNPRYSYGGGKIACELMALAWERTGILDRVVIARPHNIYGPDMGREHVIPEFCLRMAALAAAQPDGIIPFPIQGTGRETRSFCWIGDCIDQLMLLVPPQVPGGIYHIGTMDEQTVADVAHAVASGWGREIKVEPGSLPQGSPLRRLPDTAKIRHLGGGNLAATPFRAGLDATVRWYREHDRD